MKVLRVLCVLCGLLLPAAGLDREAFTFTSYNLEVRLEPGQQRLGVRGKITLRNDSSAPQKHVVLQISSSLSWRSIQAAGRPLEFVSQPYVSDIDHTGSLSEAMVELPQPVPPKGSVELEIGYEGTIPLDATRLTRIGVPEEAARHSDWDQISTSFTAVRGIGNVVWYPVATESANLSEGNSVFDAVGRWTARTASSSARMNLCLTGENGLMLLMNGKPATSSAETCREYRFDSVGRNTPGFVAADYSTLERNGIVIQYLPGHKSAAEDYILAAELASPFVRDWFGASREGMQVFELTDPQAAPFETGSTLLTPLNPNADARLSQLTMVHQLTHASFRSPRPWIYEGLAHLAQAAYREQQSGRRSALDYMGVHRTALAEAERSVAADRAQGASADQSLVKTSMEEFYRSKAMYVWWMLRDMVGEASLKKALDAYRAAQDREPSYVQHLIEARARRDLEWFFDDWVYRDRGLPEFRVESAYPRQVLGSGYLVTITVENLGEAGAEVPVRVRFQGGELTRRLEVRGKARGVIRIEAAGSPQEVVVNDGSVPESDMDNNVFKMPSGKQ